MEVKLKRIGPMQAGKMAAACYGCLALLFVPFLLLFMTVGSLASRHQEGHAHALPFVFGMGIGFMILIPIFYAVMGFVIGAVGALVYNLLAKWIGGFEFEFETKSSPAVPPPAVPPPL